MLNLVVALPAEANPLIESLKLKYDKNIHFPVYQSENTTLVISGMGRNLAAAATAWLAAQRPAAVWLNIGIAGHASMELGSLLAAHQISEAGTDKCWYPVHIKSPLDTATVITFDLPQNNYHSDCLHDMEASGFYQAALRFSTAELIHSVKVVSDNQQSPIESITKAGVEQLIGNHTPAIKTFSEHLREMASEIQTVDPDILLQNYLQHWQFSVTQKHQLHRLLQRRAALGDQSEHQSIETLSASIPDTLLTMARAKDVLHWLREDTDAQANYF